GRAPFARRSAGTTHDWDYDVASAYCRHCGAGANDLGYALMPKHQVVLSARWECKAEGCEIPVGSADTDFPDLKEHVVRVNDLRFSDVALLEPARAVVQGDCLHSATTVAWSEIGFGKRA